MKSLAYSMNKAMKEQKVSTKDIVRGTGVPLTYVERCLRRDDGLKMIKPGHRAILEFLQIPESDVKKRWHHPRRKHPTLFGAERASEPRSVVSNNGADKDQARYFTFDRAANCIVAEF